MPLSRRQFLQLTGIAVLGSTVGLPEIPTLPAAHGRALLAAPVRPQPQSSAPISHHLWPDTVLPITAMPGAWYQAGEGYIEKAHIQPILIHESVPPMLPTLQPPFWTEVTAPVAAIREWCAADAPLITRIGHGGVVQVIDQLPGHQTWYGMADEYSNLLGWTQAAGWQPIKPDQTQRPLDIQIDQRHQQMRVISDGAPLIRAAISTGRPLTHGVYPIARGAVPGIQQGDYYGAAWPLRFGDEQLLMGVYWHNQFGVSVPGAAVQVPVYVARWLYHACAVGRRIVVF